MYIRAVYKRLSNTTWQHSTAVREMAGTPPPWPEVSIALRVAVAHRSKTAFLIKNVYLQISNFVEMIIYK